MQDVGLRPDELKRIRAVFRGAPDVAEVWLYGSRADGTWQPGSDIDLALVGVRDPLRAEAIAEELEELPLPYRFDVRAYDAIGYAPLLEHIAHVGVTLYRRGMTPSRPKQRSRNMTGEWRGTTLGEMSERKTASRSMRRCAG